MPLVGWRRIVRLVLLALLRLLVLVQFVPYGRDHGTLGHGKPAWDAPCTRALAIDACFDCHSNLTGGRDTQNIAPMSWLVQRDVDEDEEGLLHRGIGLGEIDEIGEEWVLEGEMPPVQYT